MQDTGARLHSQPRSLQKNKWRSAYDPQVWQVHPLDIAFIIDSFDQLHQQIPALKGQMDSSRLGISGHSFGAYVTMLLAGATVDTPWQQNVSYGEVRALGRG